MDGPIETKGRMYTLLAGGALGNTIPQYFSVEEWLDSPDITRWPQWGVRTLTPGGPFRPYCPTAEVRETVEEYVRLGNRINISCMIDAVLGVTLWADVYDSDTGLVVYGVEHPGRGASWRKVMPGQGREWRGVSGRMMLRRHLNANSLADLEALLERWPGHVVELSACDRCFGTVPGRNGVVWEVRRY